MNSITFLLLSSLNFSYQLQNIYIGCWVLFIYGRTIFSFCLLFEVQCSFWDTLLSSSDTYNMLYDTNLSNFLLPVRFFVSRFTSICYSVTICLFHNNVEDGHCWIGIFQGPMCFRYIYKYFLYLLVFLLIASNCEWVVILGSVCFLNTSPSVRGKVLNLEMCVVNECEICQWRSLACCHLCRRRWFLLARNKSTPLCLVI